MLISMPHGRSDAAGSRPDNLLPRLLSHVWGAECGYARNLRKEFELHVTFRAGRTYCCCEALCHTGVFTEQRWRELRLALADHAVEPQEPLVVRICTRLEAGARLHYAKSDEPEPEVSDQGLWTLTVSEQSPRDPNSSRMISKPPRDRYTRFMAQS